MAKKIEHLVVLMMENRSFDHALGFLKSSSWPIDGLNGTETNPNTQGVQVRVTPDARYAGDLLADPGHDFISVNEQIFGNSQGTGTGPFMKGFVKSYQSKTGNVTKSHNVMKCFAPGRLPALSTLAREYGVCDRWFSSVPGPTLPNRAFAFGATSLGRVDMNPNYLTLKTIFELLDSNGVASKIYYTDWTIGLAVGYIIQRARKFLFFFDDFIKDCKNNRLPAFSFIEPRFNDFSDRGQFFPASDQHPDHNVFQGEKVIKAVYDALTSNRQTWESTLLVITYDEHGGLYDHVTPPATVNPGDKPPGTTTFNFERLGVRVPAVLVSPFIPRGTIVRKVFDHTSIIATARKLFLRDPDKSFLTERDRRALTFEDSLTLASPRQGKVTIPQPTNAPSNFKAGAKASARAGAQKGRAGATRAAAKKEFEAEIALASTVGAAAGSQDGGLSDFQATMIQHAFVLDTALPSQQQTDTLVSAIRTEQDAAGYLAAIRARIAEERRQGTRGAASSSSSPRASASRKAGRKAAQKAAQKASQKSSRKAGGKAARKSSQKSSQKSSRKSSGRKS
ncbi:MAG TPA: alkaline phosphatase family protein [Pyrinomonadaceae bacterium]|nr:alkaline phosphatase family protein [Pyrinomonadaceae bacterium]